MLEPIKVGDIHKSLKTQVEASQKIYQTVVALADIADLVKSNIDDTTRKTLERIMQDLVDIGDALSKNVDETTKRIQKSIEPAG